ncbi:MAG: hypothetical protein EZS28_024790 [Streblomastix strix]|uniref:Right handed beta helix domain-containing protein n=1 Tax=Streblomastix strix TaxID=222440 RepID=A0A5J4VB00_9EUKA|nr:MAG: hypothetical protein EZS28_024790 [Streblomastix strix]
MIRLLIISCFIIKGSFIVSAATNTMENQTYDGISNCQINIHYPYDKYIINNCTFSNCYSINNGGALSIYVSNGSSTNIANCTFTNCTSEANGGGIRLDISAGSISTFEGLIKFKNCSGQDGGALHVLITYYTSKLIINEMQFENCQSSNTGGGLYLLSQLQAHVYIEQLSFSNCSSQSSGGGTHIICESKCYIQINQITAEDCKCIKGNGGGIFVSIDFGAYSEFKMINISLFRCRVQTDTTKDVPPTGYGGGIFLAGQNSYDSLSKMLDFRKMKIYGNTADKAGQSLYVVMTKVVDWCKRGMAGEFVKGNYSDGISNINELQGIPVDSTTFNSYSTETINQQQNYLYNYWNIIMDEYFAQSTGNDTFQCNSSNPCKTVEASSIKSNINKVNACIVYISDSTSISTAIVISQTAAPRTFRNYPLDSTQLSDILVKSSGKFNVTGKARFQLLNFIMESTGIQDMPVIYGLSPSAEIDLQDCQFHMQDPGSQVGKCFVKINYGGNHIITNLNSKDITSLENIIKIDFSQAGQIRITDSQFENITRTGTLVAGGTIRAQLNCDLNRLIIVDCTFNRCLTINQDGGAIYVENNLVEAYITLSHTQFIECQAVNGGGLYTKITLGGQITIENSSEFIQCTAQYGNGGGIYAELPTMKNQSSQFVIRDALIQDCQAITPVSATNLSGYGGGIFIGKLGTYVASTQALDLKGMKIYGNSAIQGGQSLYVIMHDLQEWCEYGLLGEYVKGNYSDTYSDENDLQGFMKDYYFINIYSKATIDSNQTKLQNYWRVTIPQYSIWHVQIQIDGQNVSDKSDCGETKSPCQTIEYAIQQISLNKGGSETVFIEEKNIGISQYGFDLINPLQLDKTKSYTDIIKIIKQMYNTPLEMSGNAEIKILKNNDNNKENGKLGWISAFEGLKLHLYCLNIIMDNSQLLIPIIYIQDSNSLLELNSVTFSGIKLSPSTEAKGIIHINYDNSQLIASNCIFSNIQIQSKGGNAIRILNNGPQPIISNIKGCQFNNISSIGDSNGRGGSAIYMENKFGSILIIEESCQFYECIIEKGNGGAVYIDIDFSSQFEFKINNSIIYECIAKETTSKNLPPTGYGGGIFLSGNGEYDPSTKRLDLKGMKIYNNSADKSGQSLYVVMINLAECINSNPRKIY